MKYGISKEFAVIFHNGSNYDYHFIIKKLAEELEGRFSCLGENTEKYATFPVLIDKEVKRTGINADAIRTTISYK